MADFSVDIAKFNAAAKKDLRAFQTEFPDDLARAITEETPVITGNLRRSWFKVWNGPVFSYVNGTSYGVFVEFGTKHMRPRAFVRRVLLRVDSIAANTLQRIRGQKR